MQTLREPCEDCTAAPRDAASPPQHGQGSLQNVQHPWGYASLGNLPNIGAEQVPKPGILSAAAWGFGWGQAHVYQWLGFDVCWIPGAEKKM